MSDNPAAITISASTLPSMPIQARRMAAGPIARRRVVSALASDKVVEVAGFVLMIFVALVVQPAGWVHDRMAVVSAGLALVVVAVVVASRLLRWRVLPRLTPANTAAGLALSLVSWWF